MIPRPYRNRSQRAASNQPSTSVQAQPPGALGTRPTAREVGSGCAHSRDVVDARSRRRGKLVAGWTLAALFVVQPLHARAMGEEAKPTRVDSESWRARATKHLVGECRDRVDEMLRSGMAQLEGCALEVEQAQRRLAIAARRQPFGVLESIRFDGLSLRLRLLVAVRCQRWPLRASGRLTLSPMAVQGVCRVRPYSGPLQVSWYGRDGTKSQVVVRVESGRAELSVAALLALHEGAGAQNGASLGEGTWVLGAHGWAGALTSEDVQAAVLAGFAHAIERDRGDLAQFQRLLRAWPRAPSEPTPAK